MSQELRDIPGFEGRYKASRDGHIWSIKCRKFRAESMQRSGYLTITVRDEKTKETRALSVHRLVALAWIENEKSLPQINHKDGRKTNNHADNLEWCSGSQNMKHAWSKGLQPITDRMRESANAASRASSFARRRLSAEQLEDAKRRVNSGELQKDVAKSMGVSKSLISQAIRGITYRGV